MASIYKPCRDGMCKIYLEFILLICFHGVRIWVVGTIENRVGVA